MVRLGGGAPKRDTPRILAETNRDAVAKRLTADQRAQAQAQVAAWQPGASQTYAVASAAQRKPRRADDGRVAAPDRDAHGRRRIRSTLPDRRNGYRRRSGAELQPGRHSYSAGVGPQSRSGDRRPKRLRQKYANALADLALTVETADLGAKGVYHRVQAGPSPTDQRPGEMRRTQSGRRRLPGRLCAEAGRLTATSRGRCGTVVEIGGTRVLPSR